MSMSIRVLRRRRFAGDALTMLGAVLAAAAAAATGLSATSGSKTLLFLPIVVVIALGLGALALTRFSAFVYLVLGVRSAVDLFRLSGSSAGNTATNSVAAKGADPSTILAVLFLLAAFVWLSAQYFKNGRVNGSWLRTTLVLFVTASMLSAAGSAEPKVSLIEGLRILAIVMMYLVLEQLIVDRATLRRTLVACYVSLLFPLGYTLYGFLSGHPAADYKGGFTRIAGPFAQSTIYARYLGFMIIFGVALIPVLNKRARLAMIALVGLSTVFLLLTLTRGAIITTALGVLIVAVAQRRQKLVVGFVVAAIVALLVMPGLSARLSEVDAQRAAGGGPTGNTLAWRISYWTEVLPLANKNPVTGIGLDMTQYNTNAAKQPHNDFIRAYVETGLIGLATYVLFLCALVNTAIRAVRRAPPRSPDAAIAIGFLACSIAFVVESAAANVISSVVCLWYLMAFAAAGNAVARLNPTSDPVAPSGATTAPLALPTKG